MNNLLPKLHQIILAVVVLCLPIASYADTQANFTPPLDVEVFMHLQPGAICPNDMIRHLRFSSENREYSLDLQIYFDSPYDSNMLTGCKYNGHLLRETDGTPADEENLNALFKITNGEHNPWDRMFLANIGREFTLSIEEIAVFFDHRDRTDGSVHILNFDDGTDNDTAGIGDYGDADIFCDVGTNRRRYFQCKSLIARKFNQELYQDGEIELSTWEGRRDNVLNAFSMTAQEYELTFDSPSLVTEFIEDVEKGWSQSVDPDYDQSSPFYNPKYGVDPTDQTSLCSETISWYYFENNIQVGTENFKDITNSAQMRDAFVGENRFYCYDTTNYEFYPAGANLIPDTTAPLKKPQPGDYLYMINSGGGFHSMMFVARNELKGQSNPASLIFPGIPSLPLDIIAYLDGPVVGLHIIDVALWIAGDAADRHLCFGDIVPGDDIVDGALDFGVEENWDSTSATIIPVQEDNLSAIEISASGFNSIVSREFDTAELTNVTNTLAIDVKLPSPLPDPYWKGDVQMHVTCSDHNINNQWIGWAGFESLFPGLFGTVTFGLPQNVVDVFTQDGNTCSISLNLNVPSATDTYYFGDIRFL